MKKWNILLLVLIIGIMAQVVVNVYWFEYWHGNIRLEYEAKVLQCGVTLQNYEDVEKDAINYERAETDNAMSEYQNLLIECRKLTANPDRFLRGAYGLFWFMFILANLIISVLIVVVGIGFADVTGE